MAALSPRACVDRLAEDWTSANGLEFLEAPRLTVSPGAEQVFTKGTPFPGTLSGQAQLCPLCPHASPLRVSVGCAQAGGWGNLFPQ